MKTTTLAEKLSNIDANAFRQLVPSFVTEGLNNRFIVRPYQQEAIGRFIYHFEHDDRQQKPLQLLYHMATGSGKTLVMAGLILYLYDQGYRNFLFFVNSTNIIDKTRDNFLNPASSKQLFAPTIWINEKLVNIKEVSNFEGVDTDDISIAFSTIQGLHTQLNNPHENSLTYYDFEDKKIALISDEAHHINATTKKGKAITDDEELISWEGTVDRILNANNDNILLEFTATANLLLSEIAKKYNDLLIYDYPLKTFRLDGYSKEVNVMQTDMPPFQRALQAIILSQYRRKLFEASGQMIKPVILFKSKTIKDSLEFRETFIGNLKNLTVSQLQEIRSQSGDSIVATAFQYFEQQNGTLENLLFELKEDFSVAHLLTVNSKEESEQQQLAVNSLEDETNYYRIVFAVDKLNEGWDVLNLFDIVRLYDTRDAKAGKPGRTTVSEAQLIGRGARYCPFIINDAQPFAERKYDDDLMNELRICEILYYHSAYNPQYIQELNTALVDIGIKAATNEVLTRKKKAALHLAFEYKNQLNGLPDYIILQTFKAHLHSGESFTSKAFEANISLAKAAHPKQTFRLKELGTTILHKAMTRLPFYRFDQLKKRFPSLPSVNEFILSGDYLSEIKVEVNTIKTLTAGDKLSVAVQVLEDIAKQLKSNRKMASN